jgi:hypothetical protein
MPFPVLRIPLTSFKCIFNLYYQIRIAEKREKMAKWKKAVEVVCNAFPILGDVSTRDNSESYGVRKKLVINGFVILGDVKVKRK